MTRPNKKQSKKRTATPRKKSSAKAAPKTGTGSPGKGKGESRPTKKAKSKTKPHGHRLQRVLAAAGVASRRACEDLIEQGHVTVNGRTVTELPVFVDPETDRIAVDGQVIGATIGDRPAARLTIMLHKPKRTVTTADDPENRRTVFDFIPRDALPSNQRLFPVGRLDYDSTGLLLLTNDGDLAHHLTHPSFGVEKTYDVVVEGALEQTSLDTLRNGMTLAHTTGKVRKARMKGVQIVSHRVDRNRGDRTALRVVLTEGQNREIRRLLARLGLKVKRLKRIAVGPIKLKGLKAGHWRPLADGELAALRRSAGMSRSGQAKATKRGAARGGPRPSRSARSRRTPKAD